MIQEYTTKQLIAAMPNFTQIWDETRNIESNPIPENVRVTVFCNGTNLEDRGFAENVLSSDLGLNALIAESWILQTDLDKIMVMS